MGAAHPKKLASDRLAPQVAQRRGTRWTALEVDLAGSPRIRAEHVAEAIQYWPRRQF